jgi:hypothetical protein
LLRTGVKSVSGKHKPSVNYRDAGSGRFVTKKYANRHRKTTVKETNRK